MTSTIPPTLTESTQETDLANILPPTSMSWALMVPPTSTVCATSKPLCTVRLPETISLPFSTVRESHSKSQSISASPSK